MSGLLSDPLLDPFGALLVEVRDDVDVTALVDDRVRGNEPAPGDAQPTGKYKAFVVIGTLAAPPDPDVPVTFASYSFRCYGTTFQNAWAVYGAVVKAVHRVGPRLKVSGLGIYQTLVTGGGEEAKDPDTAQPYVSGVITLIATAQVVTA